MEGRIQTHLMRLEELGTVVSSVKATRQEAEEHFVPEMVCCLHDTGYSEHRLSL